MKCVPECVWHGVTWSAVAQLDDEQAARYSLDRAGGPWCKHHFARHRFSRSRQLTGPLALLAVTLDAKSFGPGGESAEQSHAAPTA